MNAVSRLVVPAATPAPLFEAGDRDLQVAKSGHQNGGVDGAILLAAEEVLALDEEHRLVPRVVHSQPLHGRLVEPFLGARALPGGFVRPDEDLDQAAARELAEETGLRSDSWHLEQLASYGTPDRDPRMRVVTVAYWAICAELPALRSGGDAAAATLVSVEEIERGAVRLAFDHERIVRDAVERTRSKLEYTTLAAKFCPPEFTIAQLRRVYETVWNTSLDPGNFQRSVQEGGAFEKQAEVASASRSRRGRPASLWSVSGSTTVDGQPAVPLERPPAKRRRVGKLDPGSPPAEEEKA